LGSQLQSEEDADAANEEESEPRKVEAADMLPGRQLITWSSWLLERIDEHHRHDGAEDSQRKNPPVVNIGLEEAAQERAEG